MLRRSWYKDVEEQQYWMDKAKQHIKSTFTTLGCPELYGMIDIEWGRANMTRAMGKACYQTKGANVAFWIKLSPELWKHASQDQRMQTAVHEACHIAAWYIYDDLSIRHGRRWQNLMRKCGLRPDRCHSIMAPERKSKLKKVACGCANDSLMGPLQYKRMLRGTSYTCTKCKQEVRRIC